MFLQILPPDNVATAQSIVQNKLVFIILCATIFFFILVRAAKFLFSKNN
jgi:hypothetical protein